MSDGDRIRIRAWLALVIAPYGAMAVVLAAGPPAPPRPRPAAEAAAAALPGGRAR